ncbi:MAG TPA: hypothetical protein VK533_16525 [Sphingomonas sp.]|uniref:hypothetical protein n=1 Tax=Sphingomonas sp. TaxID=28214 RepID=UPI002C3457C9|nr:hypothetical protein [Sphingomonas sp.]HMI21140.1 hypothetical protein [Sphingomonas sp.]
MISYRLYCLKDGRIISTALFEAEDDVAAIEAAHARGSRIDCELWCDSRLVAFIPAAAPEQD